MLMYEKIRHLLITFSGNLASWEVPAFRGAVINKVGLQNSLFHNHRIEGSGYLYRYPAIQYKTIKKMPALICIEEGVDEIHKFFEKPNWSLSIGEKVLDMKVETLNLNTYTLQVWNSEFLYSISKWLALNQENWKTYNRLNSEPEKVALLEKILKANILSFAKGVNWTVEREVSVKISEIRDSYWVVFKNSKLMALNVDFSTNVFLPPYIGLGKGVSHGFGMVKKRKQQETN